NPLDVSRAVREALPRVEASLPEGMRVDLSYDKSEFIEQSISNVFSTITEAIILVVLIIFFFLRSVRATLIPLVTIPVSLVGSFALMHLFGFSINTLTLLALILAIGLVVDDAIVMLENIYRNVEEGLPPVEAALKGSKELGFAIVAMTLTLAAVYVPIGFMTGKTGRLFTEFAWALAGAVLISGFVALTLSPMMSSKLLRRGHTSNRVSLAIEGFLDRLTSGYLALLSVALRLPAFVLMIGFAGVCAGGFAYSKLSSELAPYDDQGVILGMMVGPEGATKEYMDGYARDMEALYARVPEAERYFVIVGYPTVSRGISFLGLKPWGERERSAKEIASQLRDEMFMIPGILAFPITPPPLGQRGSDKPVQLVIQTSQPYDELQKMVDGVLARLADNDGLTNVESDLKLNLPQIKVALDRDKVADL